MNTETVFALWAMAMTSGGLVWIGRSLTLHWKRKHESRMLQGTASSTTVDEIMTRLGELERRDEEAATLERRIFDLEERLDFTERVLAQQRQLDQLPGEH